MLNIVAIFPFIAKDLRGEQRVAALLCYLRRQCGWMLSNVRRLLQQRHVWSRRSGTLTFKEPEGRELRSQMPDLQLWFAQMWVCTPQKSVYTTKSFHCNLYWFDFYFVDGLGCKIINMSDWIQINMSDRMQIKCFISVKHLLFFSNFRILIVYE